jgi:hypothetical protein
MDNSRFKFRVWDIENKCWDREPPERWQSSLICNMLDAGLTYDFGGPFLQRLRFELVQSTGLLDCDGKEIFDGDIVVRTDDESIKLFIEFRLGGFRALFSLEEEEGAHLTQITHYSNSKWRVIGNRFENPELLEIKE